MLDLFTQTSKDGVIESEVARLLGISRQTLRNWRVGYTNAYGYQPAKLQENVHWWKRRKTPRASVIFDREWVDKQLEIKKLKEN